VLCVDRTHGEVADSPPGRRRTVGTNADDSSCQCPARRADQLNRVLAELLGVLRWTGHLDILPQTSVWFQGVRSAGGTSALRLARYFGTSERFWLNLQGRYDLETEKDRLGEALARIQPLALAS
jgi:hypothetical protein